jgi:5'-nucleotidase
VRILVVNDDGIYSPGILALAQAARAFGDVRIVAPDVERSSMGHAVTHNRPLSYRRTAIADFEAFRVDGTPADCVAVGFSIWETADVVLSGINLGLNLGNSTWHSGTLAGAKQAALMGSRGIALSAPSTVAEQSDFETLKAHVAQALSLLLPKVELRLINVNFPAAPHGLQWTRQSVRHYDGKVVPAKDPMGRQHYWFGVFPVEETEAGTDRWAVDHGYVSMTPLRLDLTDTPALEAVLKNETVTS